MRNVLPLLLFAGLAVPLVGCGGDSDADDAKDAAGQAEDAAGDAADAVEHGSGMGDQDSQGAGDAKGGGEKHE